MAHQSTPVAPGHIPKQIARHAHTNMDEPEKREKEVKVGVDLGTSKLAVSFTFHGSKKIHLLKLSSSLYAQKKVEELDAVLGYAPSGWHYGPDVKVLDDAIAFTNIKLGIIGQEPYLSLLKGSFRAAAKKHGVIETPVTLFQRLFSHILATLKQLFDQPENHHHYGGRTFHDLNKSCTVTYPVRRNGSLKIVLVDAALAAGFHRVNGVSEPFAAAHYVVLQPQPIISCNETFLIIDCGGGTFVCSTEFQRERYPILTLRTGSRNRGATERRGNQAGLPDRWYALCSTIRTISFLTHRRVPQRRGIRQRCSSRLPTEIFW